MLGADPFDEQLELVLRHLRVSLVFDRHDPALLRDRAILRSARALNGIGGLGVADIADARLRIPEIADSPCRVRESAADQLCLP